MRTVFIQSLFIVAFLITHEIVLGQTFPGSNGLITDDGTLNTYSATVSGLPSAINSSFGLVSVCINITHPYDNEIVVSLRSPDSTLIDLTSHNGGALDNYTNTCFGMSAATTISSAGAPFTGTFLPEENMGNINNGQNPNGIWQLLIVDSSPFTNQGAMLNWNISFDINAPLPTPLFPFDSTNLPIVIIHTDGQLIPDTYKITARMDVIDNGTGQYNHLSDLPLGYSGLIGIKTHGSSSILFPQVSYAIETRDSAGNNNNVPLMGLPSENDWVLYSPYDDKSLIRNSLMYHLSNQIGRYASRDRFCEVYVNGDYRGVYELLEKIKIDNNRVEIANLNPQDTTGDQLTGGYIIKIDKLSYGDGYWESNYRACGIISLPQRINFIYHDPDTSELQPQQEAYIRNYVNQFENVLHGNNFADPINGFRKFADEWSFIDFSLLQEICKNNDAYRNSAYFHKDKDSNGGKLEMGPIWDFNLAFGNCYFEHGYDAEGWMWDYYCQVPYSNWLPPFWWQQLKTDSVYYSNLKCRWNMLRQSAFSLSSIDSYIDSLANVLNKPKDRQFQRWPVLGVYVWPNAYYPPTYQQEIDTLKNYIAARVAWMDSQLAGECMTSVPSLNAKENNLLIYPNPVSSESITVTFTNPVHDAGLSLLDLNGQLISKKSIGGNLTSSFRYELPDNLPAGCYFIQVETPESVTTKKLLVF